MHICTNLTAVKLPEKHLDTLITAIRQLQETPHHISQVMVLAAADLISPSRLCVDSDSGLWQTRETHFLRTGISPCQQRKRSDRFYSLMDPSTVIMSRGPFSQKHGKSFFLQMRRSLAGVPISLRPV